MQSTSYSMPLATTPRSVIRSTPLRSLTSTRCTLGRLKVARYSSLKVGRLQNWRYQGFSDSAVAGSFTVPSTRARISFILRKSSISAASASSSGSPSTATSGGSVVCTRRKISVQESATKSSSNGRPTMMSAKFSRRARCHPGFRERYQASSVGRLRRRSTEDGVRWKTWSSLAYSPR